MGSLLMAMLLVVAALVPAQSFVKAQFIFFLPNDGKVPYNPPRQLVLTAPDDIAKLTKFLPGLGLAKGGLKPGGWSAWGTLRLMRAKGPGLAVFFRSDGKVYSVVGKPGDFPAARGFRDYLLEIEKKAKQ
ncbi:MAG: hypothetical protein ACHQ50_07560 [Fimbriimonadales bacterium]